MDQKEKEWKEEFEEWYEIEFPIEQYKVLFGDMFCREAHRKGLIKAYLAARRKGEEDREKEERKKRNFLDCKMYSS